MEPNTVSGVIAACMFVAVARAFIPFLGFSQRDWVREGVIGICVVFLAIGMRLFYWDLVQSISGQHWQAVRTALGGQEFSTVFNIPAIYGCYKLLRCRLLLIPIAERSKWRWWSAWLHPTARCLRPYRIFSK